MPCVAHKLATLAAALIATANLPLSGVLPARAAPSSCAVGVGPTASTVPTGLLPKVAKAFKISEDQVRSTASVRCVGPTLMACWVGANLDCGRADVRRSLLGATAFCRANPGAAVVPMAATGHATIYDWKCAGRRAQAGKPTVAVDRQGYISANWKEVW
jgi:hypothetical protein